MILLTKVRLINWYAFNNVTAPIGFFTLIAGKNGNGKSAFLDAVKYAAYGDTVFNKSSESGAVQSRTISSYTRGLLDVTAGTYMRPADKIPNVYTHIVLEFYDEAEAKHFLLGTIIETGASNNCQTYRYVMDRREMEQVDHTFIRDGVLCPYSPAEFQKEYKVTLLNREQGLPRFMQMTGLRMNLGQIPAYLRKLRGMMSYDPDAKIDRFIRDYVLEKRNVDFKKLIDAKNNIDQLNLTFRGVEAEIAELDRIIDEYAACENYSNRLLSDDAKILYQEITDLETDLENHERDKKLAEKQQKDAEDLLGILEQKSVDLESRIVQAKFSRDQMDSARMISEEERHLDDLAQESGRLADECRSLENFQVKVSEMIAAFVAEGREVPSKEGLASLCDVKYPADKKESAAAALRALTDEAYDEQVWKLHQAEREIYDLDIKRQEQEKILEDCRRHRSTYEQIPEYTGLRDEINKEFDRRNITGRAQFACEYVIGLKDEKWRDAIEAFLGPRRYTILVPPEYYDIADDVLNRSRYRYAHLFNTRLLMQKNISVEEDSVVHMLEIKNQVAQKYFDWQLGRMHAVDMSEVKNYENAISKEGRVSVAMDSSFLRFDRIKTYYLGQETFALNQKKAENELERIKSEREEALKLQQKIGARRAQLALDKESFQDYDYNCHSKFQEIKRQCEASEKRIKELKKAQENNLEYMELCRVIDQLQTEQDGLKKERTEESAKLSRYEAAALDLGNKIEDKSARLAMAEDKFKALESRSYTVVRKAVDAYKKYLDNGKKGQGGLLTDRSRLQRSIAEHEKELIRLQTAYHVNHANADMPVGTGDRNVYESRRSRIWIDDLQEIQQKLDEQTRRYEDIFKNEFVLTVFKSCERARAELKQINGELAKLNFPAKYQFDVQYVRDGSDYSKILDYARYLDEREQFGDSLSGQLTLTDFTGVSDEEGEVLEKDLKRIINRIIEQNNEETITRFADYRNYMTYEILVTNDVLNKAKLSRQTGYNSGAEVQIPYILILSAALLLIFNQKSNSTRLVFIDEPFAKMDPSNIKIMLDFMREQKMQMIFCSPDRIETIGKECEVILPVLRVSVNNMQLGSVQFYEVDKYAKV